MKRALTIVEILAVVAILLVMAALAYPAFQSARRASQRSTCMSNLRQIGKAILAYREAEGGMDTGTPVQMGLPPHPGALSIQNLQSLKCVSNNPAESSYNNNYPDPEMDDIRQRQWARYVAMEGSGAVLIVDANHQDYFPRSISRDRWTAIGLRLDGSITSRARRGFPMFLSWWADP